MQRTLDLASYTQWKKKVTLFFNLGIVKNALVPELLASMIKKKEEKSK